MKTLVNLPTSMSTLTYEALFGRIKTVDCI